MMLILRLLPSQCRCLRLFPTGRHGQLLLCRRLDLCHLTPRALVPCGTHMPLRRVLCPKRPQSLPPLGIVVTQSGLAAVLKKGQQQPRISAVASHGLQRPQVDLFHVLSGHQRDRLAAARRQLLRPDRADSTRGREGYYSSDAGVLSGHGSTGTGSTARKTFIPTPIPRSLGY
jgi:hypothetical protein